MFLLSPSGWGNEGDNAILRGLAGAIEGETDCRVILATLSPADSASMVGHAAVPIMGASKGGYYVKSQAVARPTPAPTKRAETSPASDGPSRGQSPGLVRRMLRTLPGGVRTRLARWAGLPGTIRAELRHAARVWRWLGSARAVVVAGGGQIDELWGGPWGHPFALAFWAVLTRVRRVDFHFLGVGAGETSHRVSRLCFRLALRSANYVSVRDRRSAEVAAGLGRPDAHLSRDLAFLLVGHVHARGERERDREALTIAVSPMAYGRPGIWARPDEQAFDNLVRAYTRACEEWLGQGHCLDFFVTDSMDRMTTKEIVRDLRVRCPEHEDRIAFPSVDGLTGLLELLARSDVSVVARLHGVILSQIAHVPPVAVSHNWKVAEQLRTADRPEFAFDPRTVAGEDLTAAVDAVLADPDAGRRTGAFAESCHRIVRQDVRTLFGR